MQRDRCDWPDILNLLCATGPTLDWNHLMQRVAEDAAFLKALVSIFAWISPEGASPLPGWIWKKLELARPSARAGSGGKAAPARSAGHTALVLRNDGGLTASPLIQEIQTTC